MVMSADATALVYMLGLGLGHITMSSHNGNWKACFLNPPACFTQSSKFFTKTFNLD